MLISTADDTMAEPEPNTVYGYFFTIKGISTTFFDSVIGLFSFVGEGFLFELAFSISVLTSVCLTWTDTASVIFIYSM